MRSLQLLLREALATASQLGDPRRRRGRREESNK